MFAHRHIALLLLALPSFAMAVDEDMVKEALRNCEANQLAINICAWNTERSSEVSLQVAYDRLRTKLRASPQSLRALEKAQESWRLFRELNCEYQVSGLDPHGSMVSEWLDDCRSKSNSIRQRALEEFLECTEAGCPGE